MQQQQQSNPAGVGLAFFKVWVSSLYLPLRFGMGKHHLGFSPLFSYLLIYFWSQATRAPGLNWLIAINMVAYYCQLLGQAKRRKLGIPGHTYWQGSSWLGKLFRDDDLAKLIGEPALSVFVGWVIYKFTNQPDAATYFWYGAILLFTWELRIKQHNQRVLEEMGNAAIENLNYRQQMRRRKF